MLQGLKPVSGKHSIKNAEAQIFLPQAFVAIEEDFNKFQGSKEFGGFQKKGLIKPTTIRIGNKGLGLEQSPVSGYIFERFESDGSLKDIFKAENSSNDERSALSLATRKYSRWNNFKSDQLQLMYQALEIIKPYVNAISFSYLDEFDWQEEEEIPVNQIFNSASELPNKKFLDSKNGSLILMSQGALEDEHQVTEEKIQLSFNNNLKKVQISHQFLVRFNAPYRILELDDASKLTHYFDIVHKEHKRFLDHLLTDECKRLINFKL